ncbi:MAG: Xylose isomerase domain protein barrel [Acidimicrobiaceae bacterium]|nr:Xylose isomerase domain protein barrel [Acidimicrobiaceae bacterium]
MTTAEVLKERSQFGVMQNVLCNTDMASDLDIVVEAGVTAVGVRGDIMQRAGVSETIRLMSERSLIASSYLPSVRLLDFSEAATVDVLRNSLTVAAALQAPTMLIVTGPLGDLPMSQAEDQFVSKLNRVASLAVKLGVRLAIEPVHPLLRGISYVHTLRHAADLASRISGCGVVLDVVHTYWDRYIYEDISAYASSVCTVHLSNVDRSALEQRRLQRAPLDKGVIPVEEMIRALHDAGYRGFYENEVLVRTERAACIEAVRSAREWFDALWDG